MTWPRPVRFRWTRTFRCHSHRPRQTARRPINESEPAVRAIIQASKWNHSNVAPKVGNLNFRSLSKTCFRFQILTQTLSRSFPVLVLPSGSIPSNHHIQSLIQEIKPKITKMLENITKLRMWVIFLIPKIEDGNNFGVGIQVSLAEKKLLVSSSAF